MGHWFPDRCNVANVLKRPFNFGNQSVILLSFKKMKANAHCDVYLQDAHCDPNFLAKFPPLRPLLPIMLYASDVTRVNFI